MKCPYCLSPTNKVLDKREVEDLSVTRRRRRCTACGARFTTYERVEMVPLMLVKKDGRREEFDRAKLRSGLAKACAKRPVSAADVERAIDEIEAELRRRQEGGEVSHATAGELVMDKLRQLDNVAYIRFASVYRAFADLSSFEEEIERARRVALEGPRAVGPPGDAGAGAPANAPRPARARDR